MDDTDEPRAWTHHGTRRGPDLRLFQVRFDDLENPRTGEVLERLVLETPDWVNVVALTPERDVVLVRQWRFGSRSNTLEIPGGMVDPGEEHRAAAERELREESGYTAQSWRYLGSVLPNPAIHDNRLHMWLAEGCRPGGPPELDPGEDIQVLTLPLAEVLEAATDGRIEHSLVLCALMRVAGLRTPGTGAPGSV
ncbi:NUDIX hydrolase [Engelhardtia mirabilis]|uniref:GDP-mannose pyrophosphatase n=1 Tax=Engelhardtia mirabilis TaxID=2528011 RepID=A0A518BKX6_9BACT|nr:ADP-ribose pyrophosphatase [Planctomycetes bacterium Pla133]QDV01956.1 ADP-ribose pyrophosphatase [Planctomycetes bacterium Pla86]